MQRKASDGLQTQHELQENGIETTNSKIRDSQQNSNIVSLCTDAELLTTCFYEMGTTF